MYQKLNGLYLYWKFIFLKELKPKRVLYKNIKRLYTYLQKCYMLFLIENKGKHICLDTSILKDILTLYDFKAHCFYRFFVTSFNNWINKKPKAKWRIRSHFSSWESFSSSVLSLHHFLFLRSFRLFQRNLMAVKFWCNFTNWN